MLLVALAVLPPCTVMAQQRGVAALEVVTGHAGFVDDAWDHRVMAGGVVRLGVSSRFTIGPEVVYLHGRSGSHDLILAATATWDMVAPAIQPRVVPFIVLGVGIIRQSSLVGRGPGTSGLVPYSSRDGTASVGIGARVRVSRHLFIAPDARLGWEPESRITVALGWRP